MNHYGGRIGGLSESECLAELCDSKVTDKAAWRKYALDYHPDRYTGHTPASLLRYKNVMSCWDDMTKRGAPIDCKMQGNVAPPSFQQKAMLVYGTKAQNLVLDQRKIAANIRDQFINVAQRVFKLDAAPKLYSAEGKELTTDRSLGLAIYRAGQNLSDLKIFIGAPPKKSN